MKRKSLTILHITNWTKSNCPGAQDIVWKSNGLCCFNLGNDQRDRSRKGWFHLHTINVDRVPRKYHQETDKANQIDVVFSTAQLQCSNYQLLEYQTCKEWGRLHSSAVDSSYNCGNRYGVPCLLKLFLQPAPCPPLISGWPDLEDNLANAIVNTKIN